MMKRDDNEFRIRTYGRTELALAYFPELTPDAAWRKLRGWIELNPTLRQQLCSRPRLGRLRTFTPRQVQLIADELGEPY